MLLGLELDEREDVALGERRQAAALLLRVLALLLVDGLRGVPVDAQETLELKGAAGAMEERAVVLDVRGSGVVDGLDHLGGQEALPDKLVEAYLVGVEKAADLVGRAQHARRAYGLVGFLGGSGLGLVGRYSAGRKVPGRRDEVGALDRRGLGDEKESVRM